MKSGKNGRVCGRRHGWLLAAGGLISLVALVAIGCGGGGGTNIFPFAGVWVANSGGKNVLHFAGSDISQLSGSFNVPPKTFLNSAVFISPQDTVFDSSSNLWVVDGGFTRGSSAAVYEFSSVQLAHLNSTPAPTPVFVVTAPVGGPAFFNFPQFAVFDGGGNLWISDSGNSEIFEFTKAQLSSPSGLAVAPAATLVGAAPGLFVNTLGMAFDSGGNLWVANNGGTTIVQISAVVLASARGVTLVTPTTVLNTSIVGGLQTINNPWGILFDNSGNMWFTNEQLSVGACAGSVVEFAKASISAGGALVPAPKVVITQTAIAGTESLCDPNGISMNSSGSITVANAVNDSLAEFTAAQITTGGTIAPNVFIDGGATTMSGPAGLSYGPLFLQ